MRLATENPWQERQGDLVAHLWTKHRIITTPIPHEEFQGVRVTPNVYTTLEEVDTFAAAMERIAG